MARNSFLLLFFIAITAGCEGGSPPSMMAADFLTMHGCLESIQKSAGSAVDKIIRDKPDIVTGFLADRRQFACEKKTSGTKGTYYYGWYTLPPGSP